MTHNYKIIISCRDRSFEISPDSAAHLTEGGLVGFDMAGFDVTVCPYAAQHGGYAQKRRFAERELSLSFEIDKSDEAEARRALVSMLDPRYDCTIDVTLRGVRRTITAIPCDTPVFRRPTFSDLTAVTLYFTAPTVFFSGAKEESLKLHDCAGLLTFPMNFMSGAGLTAGFYRVYGSGTIENTGDVECGFVAKITAEGGTVVNPTIALGDSFIRCPLTLADGDTLTVDTRPKMKNILLNGERCFIFDKRSEFFTLPAGKSEISVTADRGEEFIGAVIEFKPNYCGV